MYEKMKADEPLIVRDYLALERTRLANTRTLLAYARTAIGSFGAGVGLVKLIDMPEVVPLGYALMIAAPFVMALGVVHALRVSKRWHKLDK